jgi:hypothetical protein
MVIEVNIIDKMVSHEPMFFSDTAHLTLVKNKPIQHGAVVIYTDESLADKKEKPPHKAVALLIESPEYHRRFYDYIAQHNHLFDLVLTFDKTLLDRGENFRLNLCGITWLNVAYRQLWPKTKFCSLILSNKRQTSGHRLRHAIAERLHAERLHDERLTATTKNIDLYGPEYIQLPFATTKPYAPDHSPTHLSNQKILALKDYRFSVVIENCKTDYYFTEKLMDAFLTGTVPIYYGCPSIGQFFNSQGILTFSTAAACHALLTALQSGTKAQDMYEAMRPYIMDNFERAQKYIKFIINEEPILAL